MKRLEKGIEPERFEDVKPPKLPNRGKREVITWDENYALLSDWSKNRVRFHMHGEEMLKLTDPTRTICYHLYKKCLEHSGNSDLIGKYRLDDLVEDPLQVKKLSEYMKKKGTAVEKKWRYLVDLHRLNDYLPYAEEGDFIETIEDWVNRKVLHTWNGDEEKWYHIFREECRQVLRRSGVSPDDVPTVDEFIENGDIWCTSGSGFEPEVEKLRLYDKSKQEELEVKKNKWSCRWNMSKYKTKKLMFKKRVQICKAVQKSEPGKVRAVISSDLSLYLKMSYVSLWLDKYFAGRTDSTLWMSKLDKFLLWQKMAFDGTWRMPLDQSEFDKNVTQRQVLIMLEELKYLMEDLRAPEVLIELMDEIIFALSGGYVVVGGKKIPITNGILSGWRWTAFLDTLVNLIEVAMAIRWVQENSNIVVKILDLCAQGDDDWFKFKDRRSAIAVWLGYESFNLQVNPGKFFLDTVRDEFLRRVMDNKIVTGYPARSISGLCFRNPLSERESVGMSLIRNNFSRWKLLAERLDVNFAGSWFERKWNQDCRQGVKGSTEGMLTNALYIPAMLGGIGLDSGFWQPGDVYSDSLLKPDNLEILGDGYDEWVKHAEKYGVSERTVKTFAISTLDLTGKYRIPTWVKYIVSDPPVNGYESGLDWDRPGSIAIGYNTRKTAYRKKIKWFKTFIDAKSIAHYTDVEVMNVGYKDFDTRAFTPVLDSKSLRLRPVTGISVTLAQMSEQPELVWSNYDIETFKHKPTSWTKNFLQGKLKTNPSPRSGWGTDVTGYISSRLLGSAINAFLVRKHPSLTLWDNLLATIDAIIPKILNTLIRVVE